MKKDKDISTIKEPIEALATEFMVLGERLEKLVELLNNSKATIQWYMDNSKPDNNHCDFFNIGMNQITEIEELINKDK